MLLSWWILATTLATAGVGNISTVTATHSHTQGTMNHDDSSKGVRAACKVRTQPNNRRRGGGGGGKAACWEGFGMWGFRGGGGGGRGGGGGAAAGRGLCTGALVRSRQRRERTKGVDDVLIPSSNCSGG